MQGVLEVSGLAVERGGVVLAENLSFSLGAGQVLVLRGPNGSGKTTLIRTLAGLQPPVEGQVVAAELAYAGHLDGIKAQLMVLENLRFWADVLGGKEIDRALAAFDLERLAERPARALSAGQKRRLGLARLVLAGRPLWLLDEPTVSLDQASVRLFAQAVKHHLATGGAAVIATHIDLGLDARVLDLTPYRAKKREDVFGGAW